MSLGGVWFGYADNFYFNDGDDVRTLINDAGEVDFSKMKKIDLGGIVLDGETGNINFTGAGSITWGDNAPVKYQFSTSLSGPWHDTMGTNDKYRRDSLDGGTTWGSPYQFRGQDGSNGSDANVTFDNILKALQKAASTKETFITADSLGAPTIYGGEIYGATMYSNEFNVYPEDGEVSSGGLVLYGNINGGSVPYEMFRIRYVGQGSAGPSVTISAPGATHTYWNMSNTHFSGSFDFEGEVDFSSATVTGIHATFA